MIVELAEFLSGCPSLRGEKVRVNYLDGVAGKYSLEANSAKTDERLYADGGRLCKRWYLFSFRGEYGKADAVNQRVAKTCAEIEKWIESQNKAGMLPEFGDGITTVSCGVLKGFAPVGLGSVDARYEAEIEIVFYKN